MKDIHSFVSTFSKKHKFDTESLEQKMMILTEEVGELAKAVRRYTTVKIGSHSKKREFSEEAADVLYVLVDICNTLNVDLEDAFSSKMKKIEKRMKK